MFYFKLFLILYFLVFSSFVFMVLKKQTLSMSQTCCEWGWSRCEKQQLLEILDFRQKAIDEINLEMPQIFSWKTISWPWNKTKTSLKCCFCKIRSYKRSEFNEMSNSIWEERNLFSPHIFGSEVCLYCK